MSTTSPHSHPERTPKQDSVVCLICGKPVPLENAKTDADGQSVHEICYAWRLQLEQAIREGYGQTDGQGTQLACTAIAEEVTREQDSQRLTELMLELSQALNEQNLDGSQKRSDSE